MKERGRKRMSIDTYITIDLNDDLIRIPRSALNMLDCPDYIQLLFHPENRKIAVKACSEKDRYSVRVNKALLKTDNSFELHSKFLINSIRQICPHLELGCAYHINGRFYDEKKIAVYDLYDVSKIKG
jgi:hypothetical protein